MNREKIDTATADERDQEGNTAISDAIDTPKQFADGDAARMPSLPPAPQPGSDTQEEGPFGPDESIQEAPPETQIQIRTPDLIVTITAAGRAAKNELVTVVTRKRTKKQAVKVDEGQAGPPPKLHFRIRRAAFDKLQQTVGSLPAERGGIFVGADAFCIEDFIFDDGSKTARAVYYPDTHYLNDILERLHEPFGRRFIGLAHSHPSGYWRPSGDEHWGDIKAARNNLLAKSNSDLPALFIPIIESLATTGTFVIHPFVMVRGTFSVHRAQYEVVD